MTPRYFGNQGVATPRYFFYLDLNIGLHGSILKLSNWNFYKGSQICENFRLIAHKLRSEQNFCHTNSKTTPRYFGHRGVMTRRVPKDQGVTTRRYLGNRQVVLLFVWAFKPMLLPLEQHSFIKLSKININYTKIFDLCLKKFPSPRIFGFLSTGKSF